MDGLVRRALEERGAMKSDVVLHQRTAAVLLEWFRNRQATRCCMWNCLCQSCARDLKELCSNECEDHFFCWAAAELIPADLALLGLSSDCNVEACGGCNRHISTRCCTSDRRDHSGGDALDFAIECVEESICWLDGARKESARRALAYLQGLKGDGA